MEHGKALSETATLLSIWAVMKQAPMNMSQSCLENGRSTNEPVEKAKEPAVLTVRITMCLAGS